MDQSTLDELKKDMAAVLDAVKELTTTIAEMTKSLEMLRKAGKF